MRGSARARRQVAMLAFVTAFLMIAVGIWNLLSEISGTWFTVVAFLGAAVAVDAAVVQLWVARRLKRS